ncbi:hypothetical protein MHYP_G00144120 [Metynnis hypsauchen]
MTARPTTIYNYLEAQCTQDRVVLIGRWRRKWAGHVQHSCAVTDFLQIPLRPVGFSKHSCAITQHHPHRLYCPTPATHTNSAAPHYL